MAGSWFVARSAQVACISLPPSVAVEAGFLHVLEARVQLQAEVGVDLGLVIW